MTTETAQESTPLDTSKVETSNSASPSLSSDELERYDRAVTVAIGALRDLPELARDLNDLAPRVIAEFLELRVNNSILLASVERMIEIEIKRSARDLETERDGYRSMLCDVIALGGGGMHEDVFERARATLKHGMLGPKRFFAVNDGGASYYLVARDLEHAKSLLRDHGVEFTDDSGDSAPIDDPRFADLKWLELSLEVAEKKIVTLGDSGAGPKSPLASCCIGEWFTDLI